MKAATIWRLKSAGRAVLPQWIRRAVGRQLGGRPGPWQIAFPSEAPKVLRESAMEDLEAGWQDPSLPERQRLAVERLLSDARRGQLREDFAALVEAVRATAIHNPLVVEVGCSTAWNAEVLSTAFEGRVRYIGVDRSFPMASGARQYYPMWPFTVGDAVSLPLRSASCDILLSGTLLMHVADYRGAVRESHRVARRWCIFHGIPMARNHPTTLLTKGAYGSMVLEVVFNVGEFKDMLRQSGFTVRSEYQSVRPGYLDDVLGERAESRTFLCEKT